MLEVGEESWEEVSVVSLFDEYLQRRANENANLRMEQVERNLEEVSRKAFDWERRKRAHYRNVANGGYHRSNGKSVDFDKMKRVDPL